MHENRIVKDFENIMTYRTLGKLNNTIESKGTIVTLNDLNREIMEMNLIRKFIFQKFKSDVIKTFEKNDSKDIKLEFDYRNLLLGDKLLTFDIYFKDEIHRIVVSDDKIYKSSYFNSNIESKIEQISEYIEGLFRVLKNSETANLLSNKFYVDLHLKLEDYMEKFQINGDGISLSIFNFDFDKIGTNDKYKILDYFYKNYELILNSIFVEDDRILDNYRLNNNVDKRMVLSIYNKKR